MNGKDWAVVIAALGTLGLPVLLLIFTVGSLFAGFALWSVLGFLSSWMVPLIFAGIAALILIEFAPRGPLEALIAVVIAVVFLLVGYVIWSGALKGPANTYSLLLSVAPGSQATSVALPVVAMFWGAIVLAVFGLGYVLIIREFED